MLKVNEIFGPTIQGEGKSQGKQVMFVRLSLCNLYCTFCDTPYTWNWVGTRFIHPQKFRKELEIHNMTVDEVWQKLTSLSSQVKRIVISGGEPMVQQKRLIPLLDLLVKNNYEIEVETNGTIVPTEEFLNLVDQVNCSPKLSNSGNTEKDRLKPEALSSLSKSHKVSFKFVVTQYADIHEINELVKLYAMRNVYLMPEGRAVEELNRHASSVQRMCDEFKYTFTDRLQIRMFGTRRAV